MVIERVRNDTTTVCSEDTDLVWERTFDAPRELVWQAFMDPERVRRWWGPHGSTPIVVEMDVRPGGRWRYISRAPDRRAPGAGSRRNSARTLKRRSSARAYDQWMMRDPDGIDFEGPVQAGRAGA